MTTIKKPYLIDFKEYIDSKLEISNYEVPFAAVIPAKDDKIWHYIKNKISQGPKWGVDFKKQELDNQRKGQRDGETGKSPHDNSKT
jgi:hypothetical protein